MVNPNIDTVQYISSPSMIAGNDLIQKKLALVEELLIAEQSGQPGLLGDAAVQLLQAGGKRIRASINLSCAAIFYEEL